MDHQSSFQMIDRSHSI